LSYQLTSLKNFLLNSMPLPAAYAENHALQAAVYM
jgi:hypothetical protein